MVLASWRGSTILPIVINTTAKSRLKWAAAVNDFLKWDILSKKDEYMEFDEQGPVLVILLQ